MRYTTCEVTKREFLPSERCKRNALDQMNQTVSNRAVCRFFQLFNMPEPTPILPIWPVARAPSLSNTYVPKRKPESSCSKYQFFSGTFVTIFYLFFFWGGAY